MDKLKPIIEQKFWIFLGLALIIPFVGWSLATSTYATGVENREQAIDGSFNSLNFPANPVNEDWIEGAEEIVQDEQQQLEMAQQDLWLSQKQEMKWPRGVDGLMADVPYEGEIPSDALENYSNGYFRQLAEIEQELRPFDVETGEGVLLFNSYLDGADYTHVPVGQWARQAPTSTEMWNAQIDLWLVQAVFESIQSMNQGETKITEAPIRQLLELTLRGGDRDYSPDAGGEGGEGGEGMMHAEMSTGESGGRGVSVNTSVRFDLSEELGPMNDQRGESGGALDDYMAEGEGTDGEAAEQGPGRYVDDDEGYPFRTRAFVLGVVMDHRDLPRFMSELSRSDWPIQIIRVQTAAYNPDTLEEAGRRSGRSGTRTAPRSRGGFGESAFSSEYEYESSDCGPASAFGSSEDGFGSTPRPRLPSGGGPAGAGSAAGMVQQAMSDPYLSEVWIGGLITLFRPVENPPADDSATSPETVTPGETAGAEPSDAATTDPTDPTEANSETEPGTTPSEEAPGAPATDNTDNTETAPEPDSAENPSAPTETDEESETPGTPAPE